MRGFRKKTNEEIASEKLYDFFSKQEKNIVHCWHPPDGKAYFTLLLQLPQVNSFGQRTSQRDHIDLIVQIEDTLLLLEVKGTFSDIQIDIDKLNNIKKAYSVAQIVELFKQQGAKFETVPKKLVLGLAATNDEIELTEEFAILQANQNGIFALNNIAKKILKKR